MVFPVIFYLRLTIAKLLGDLEKVETARCCCPFLLLLCFFPPNRQFFLLNFCFVSCFYSQDESWTDGCLWFLFFCSWRTFCVFRLVLVGLCMFLFIKPPFSFFFFLYSVFFFLLCLLLFSFFDIIFFSSFFFPLFFVLFIYFFVSFVAVFFLLFPFCFSKRYFCDSGDWTYISHGCFHDLLCRF